MIYLHFVTWEKLLKLFEHQLPCLENGYKNIQLLRLFLKSRKDILRENCVS